MTEGRSRAPACEGREAAMSMAHSTPIDRPSCPKCDLLMWIVRIHPNGPGVDKRTFECPVCDISEKAMVKLKSV